MTAAAGAALWLKWLKGAEILLGVIISSRPEVLKVTFA
jgi:hypothetical protein